MKFEKYKHVERLGTEATDGILDGTCYVFPKRYKSLQILATNDEQHKAARRVYDEAWKILKVRKKDDARPTVREVLNKYGLTCDDLIQAVLAAYKSKFDSQYSELESELARLFN